MTVIQNQDDPTTKPTALVMTQASPRENYLVRYAVSLTADATVPGLAPAVIGSPIVAPGLRVPAAAARAGGAAYADILLKGDESEYYPPVRHRERSADRPGRRRQEGRASRSPAGDGVDRLHELRRRRA